MLSFSFFKNILLLPVLHLKSGEIFKLVNLLSSIMVKELWKLFSI